MSNQYEYFDRVMATRNPDFLFISHQMSAIAHTMVSADSELLWRLSQATFGITFNMDWFRDQAGIKTKTQEAKTFAERAIKANPESFGAHLWMAKCIGQIILVEKSKLAALSHLGQMRFHLSQASTMQPTNWRVLLLEAQVQVGLYEHLKELKAGGMDINGVVEPLPLVEQKLANCLSQNPMSHEAFFAQTCVLFMQVRARGERHLNGALI